MNGLVMLDVATRYFDCEPSESRDTETTEINLRCFAGDVKVRRLYYDNDDALIAVARNRVWKHDFSKPHDPQINCLIESHVGIAKSGARALLYQEGMPAMCRPWAVKYVLPNGKYPRPIEQVRKCCGIKLFPQVPTDFRVHAGARWRSCRVPAG